MTERAWALPRGVTGRDLALGALAAVAINGALLAVLILARTSVPPEPKLQAVRIVLAPPPKDLPLLKLGSRNPKRTVLPDLHPKQTLRPRRKEPAASSATPPRSEPAASQPSPKTPDAPSLVEPAPATEALGPEGAATSEPAPNLTTEGSEEGVVGGTEVDPLKARWISQYELSIIQWFDRLFSVPADALDAETRKTLFATATADIAPDRVVTGFQVTSPSGNPVFDARVDAALAGAVGRKIPPPPAQLAAAPGFEIPRQVRLKFHRE